ncbi:hypothetical protein [Peptostreptococcus equinus]|uniref:Uncharacterized protein n=1 Tax=Peptostreptococcus equinus TaxID=3003601 RepID=A0ABY7JMH1_9FIRM|nr:hypothetical protein [Peptostreptococcus sp. CBA3647]WAW14559.1 hypothetical protein O0R46_08135 [Peptostreptococcus sp. CBA3647]
MNKKIIFSILFVLFLSGALFLDFYLLPQMIESGKSSSNISSIVIYSIVFMNILYFIIGYFLSKVVASACRPHKIYYLVKILVLAVLIIFTIEIGAIVLGLPRIGIFPEHFLTWLVQNSDRPQALCTICGILFGIKPMKRENFKKSRRK